jgi:hypothetical protein
MVHRISKEVAKDERYVAWAKSFGDQTHVGQQAGAANEAYGANEMSPPRYNH